MTDTFGRSVSLALLLLVVALLSGCASASGRDNPFRGGGPDDESQLGPNEALIEVDHLGRTGSDVTVYLISGAGGRRRLGRVSLGGEERFRVSVGGASEVRLLGEITGEQDIVSRFFVLRAGRGVRWDIALNQISILR